jgi:glycine/D-amino acid oxidase-like deaminating enzyme/nitrite reductase/ring-hydroxylating ferredoxin subunit
VSGTLPGRPVSPWLDGPDGTGHPPLERDLEVDVAVLGGGIAGLSAALELQEDGAEVALLEARSIGSGVSGNTTAKLSALHGLSYASIESAHGPATARAYAHFNQAGLARVRELAERLGIDCDLREQDNFTYSEDVQRLDELRDEVAAARAAGLPVSLETSSPLPFEIEGAVRCTGQAEFHPVKYLRGLAAALAARGVAVHERTRANSVSGGRVETEGGPVVDAGHVIVATHLPFLDRGLFFARASVQRSYAISVRLKGKVPAGMHLQAESPGRSLRGIPWQGEELLMVGGESHALGAGDPAARFQALEDYARSRFDVAAIEHRWDAHDFMPDDGLPYVGRLTPGSERVLVATGMRKWGLAMSAAAGRILADRVAGRESEEGSMFDPWRLPGLGSLRELIEHNSRSGFHFFADRLPKRGRASRLAPGEGAVLGSGLSKKAVHRDRQGSLHAVSARCTHLGCIVEWNAPEATWDCPCHGSRFGPMGEVMEGPATAPLDAESLEADD